MTIRKTFEKNHQTQISYLEWNQGKIPLLLLHGMADNSQVWSSLGEHLQEKYHIIAPDLRGYGNSSKPKTGYFNDDIIDDLQALINYLKWDKFHVIAHSWSAKLVPIWATKNPAYFQTMILVDPFYINKIPSWSKMTFPLLYKVLPFLKMTGTFNSYELAKHTAQSLKQYQGWSALQQQVFEYSIEKNEHQQWSNKFTSQAKEEIFTDVMLKAGLTKVLTIPTLFIKPEKGLNKSSWQISPFKKYLPNLTIKTVPGNHWDFLVEPEIFNQTVEQFLAKY